MLTSAPICKQRHLHENEIVQLLHNYKSYGIEYSHFRKLLNSSAMNVKNNYRKTTRSFLPAAQFVTSLNVKIVRTFTSFWPRKIYITRDNNKVDSIETGLIVIADFLPWSDLEKCMYTTLF